MRPLLLLPALLLLLAAPPVRAHDADLLVVHVQRTPAAAGAVEVRERVTLTAGTLALLVPADADGSGAVEQADLDARAAALGLGVWDAMPLSAGGVPCERLETAAQLRPTFVELSARFACAQGELAQRFTLLSVLPDNYRVVMAGEEGAAQPQRFADARSPTLLLTSPLPAPVRGLLGWVRLGVHHIFAGVDHLAFLLALLLVGGSARRVLATVTAFTVAHSLTLGATALGFIVLDAERTRWVEAAIAASIVYVALENLLLKEHAHRALLTFLFGLVHGFGFASVLSGYGLGDAVATGLLGFNLGVELGQAGVVLALLPLVRWVQRRPRLDLWQLRVVSVALALAGSYWLVERTLG
jgi:hypothetical protein